MSNSMQWKKWLLLFPAALIAFGFIYNVFFISRTPDPGLLTYQRYCSNCHGDEGEGVRQLIPPLMNSDYAKQHLDSLPCWIRNGMSHKIEVNGKSYEQPMYPIREITDVELTNIMNYVNVEFLKNEPGRYNSAEVNQWMKNCK